MIGKNLRSSCWICDLWRQGKECSRRRGFYCFVFVRACLSLLGTLRKKRGLLAAMASYGKPTAPPYNQGQSWQQQQTPSYAAQSGSSYYGQSTPPSPYGQQQTQYGQAPSSAYSSYGQQPSAYSSYGQQPSGYSSYGQTTYPPYGQTSYGQVPSSRARFPPGTESEIVSVFEMADTDGSGTIDAKELARVLSVYSPFSPRTVRLMLHIYADNSYNTTSIGTASFSNSLWVLSEHHIVHAGV
jgi:hypothetical protein